MKKLLLIMSILSILGFSSSAAPIDIGASVPDVTGIDQSGKPVAIKELAATGYTLVYFYPKADTPGCTAQACSLRDAYASLEAKSVRVIGVSADTPEEQKKFQEKYNFPLNFWLTQTEK